MSHTVRCSSLAHNICGPSSGRRSQEARSRTSCVCVCGGGRAGPQRASRPRGAPGPGGPTRAPPPPPLPLVSPPSPRGPPFPPPVGPTHDLFAARSRPPQPLSFFAKKKAQKSGEGESFPRDVFGGASSGTRVGARRGPARGIAKRNQREKNSIFPRLAFRDWLARAGRGGALPERERQGQRERRRAGDALPGHPPAQAPRTLRGAAVTP